MSNYRIHLDVIQSEIGPMIVRDEQPFVMIEYEGFKHVRTIAGPEFKMMSRRTIKRDTMSLYERRKKK